MKKKFNTQVHILVLPFPSLVTPGEIFFLRSPRHPSRRSVSAKGAIDVAAPAEGPAYWELRGDGGFPLPGRRVVSGESDKAQEVTAERVKTVSVFHSH